jgi:hypothetical protein
MSKGPTSRFGGFATVALATVAIVLPAQALGATGETKLTLDGPAANALREQGVRIVPLKPATGGSRKVALPVAAGLAGSGTTLLRHRGGISLESPDGGRARLTKLSLLLGARSLVEAKLGNEEIDLFKVLRGGLRDIDPATGRVRLGGLRLKLTPAAARALAARLGLDALPARRFGTLATAISGLTPGDNASPTSGGPSSPTGPAPKSTACPLPGGAGPAPEDPLPVATRPPGATDITAATLDWQVRDSFVRYIDSGEGTSISGGATADPPLLLPGASASLSYGFQFPFAGASWLDAGANPADPADDSALLRFGGAVRFHYSGHGIDLSTAEPEIEIAGAKSRAIFSISESGGAAQRQVLINLDLSRAAAITASGSSFTYERVPGAIPSGTAASTFAGFYAPGTDFGCATVSFSTAG